jgi:hypothetical protein
MPAKIFSEDTSKDEKNPTADGSRMNPAAGSSRMSVHRTSVEVQIDEFEARLRQIRKQDKFLLRPGSDFMNSTCKFY